MNRKPIHTQAGLATLVGFVTLCTCGAAFAGPSLDQFEIKDLESVPGGAFTVRG